MADKARLSVASSVGFKGMATTAAHFKELFNPPSSSSLSNIEDGKEERIEIENLLKIEDLETLRLKGFSRDEVLTKEQFIEFLRTSLNRGSDKDYDELFECVDVTKEGTISWDKLATYLMLKLYDNDDRERASSVPNWKNTRTLLNAHRDSIKRIQHMDSFSRYISISKEGTVCIYNDEMYLYKTFKATTESCKVRDLWVTDFVLMTNVNKIAVAYTSKELIIYDMTSKLEFNLVYRIVGIDATLYCLDYWADLNNPNDAILSWGDVKGDVHAVLFNSALIALFERPAQQSNDSSYTRVKLEDIANGTYKNASYLTYHAHAEWTRKVKYADHLDCFLSCSTHAKTALVFGWMDRSGLTVRASFVLPKIDLTTKEFLLRRMFTSDDLPFFSCSDYSVRIRKLREARTILEINQGLNSFDYSRTFNLIATAGVNYQVTLWNPFVLSKPNGILRGHMRSVCYVQFIPSRGQLLSFSKDKILRVWDVQLQICLQRLSNVFPRGPEVEMFCWFDDARSRLFASFRTSLSMLEIKPEIKDRIMTHDRAIVAVRYIAKQKQVMVVCQAGDISFWSLEGQKTKRFSEQDGGDIFDTTCLGFDEFGEKFYTGGTDGKIRIWNYNGRMLQILDAGKDTSVEITQIEALKRRILAVGWSKYLTVFRDLQQSEGRAGVPTEWNGEKDRTRTEGHEDDIVCMSVTSFSPQLLASGSVDGDICIWNTSSELFVRRLDQRKRHPNNTQAKLKDNAADFTITTLKFLNTRIISNTNNHPTGATLLSCGGIGFVRFWNVSKGKLVGEYQAHTDVSSIIMEIDLRNKYLGTGDVNGVVKVWDIEHYCLQSDFVNLEITFPPLLAEFTPHSDSITCIDFLVKDERMFILTSSSDCSVVLSDLNGNAYGTFGQPNQWRLDMDLSKSNDEEIESNQVKDESKSQEENITQFDEEPQITLSQDLDVLSSMSDEEILTRRSNVWESTSIGVSYQEKRTNRRQRNQPSLITKKDYIQWEKTGIAPGGAYGALDTFEPPNIPENKRPNYLDTAYIWSSGAVGDNARRRRPPSMIGENLKSAFDERSIFPKYILDYEAKQRQLFESPNQAQTTTTGGLNPNSQTHTRQPTEAAMKVKRHGSSSTITDPKTQ